MVLRRAVYEEVGGFDEINLPVSYNDVDFCLRLRARGYRIVWTPYAELDHLESVTRGQDYDRETDKPGNDVFHDSFSFWFSAIWLASFSPEAHLEEVSDVDGRTAWD